MSNAACVVPVIAVHKIVKAGKIIANVVAAENSTHYYIHSNFCSFKLRLFLKTFSSSRKKFLQELIQWAKRICINVKHILQWEKKWVKMLNFVRRCLKTVHNWFSNWRNLQRINTLYSSASVGHFLHENVCWLHENILTSETESALNTLLNLYSATSIYVNYQCPEPHFFLLSRVQDRLWTNTESVCSKDHSFRTSYNSEFNTICWKYLFSHLM